MALLPWIGYLAVGWVIGEAMDYLIGYLPDNECNPLLSLQRWANAASYAVTISSAQKGVKALTAAAKLRRGLGGRGAGAENTEKIASGGAIRAEKYSNNWSTGNLDKAINKFAGKNPIITTTEKGKRIYTNPTTGIQVVEDMSGNYFRIYNPNISGRRSYLDLNGNIPNNKFLENGKQTGRSQSEYNKVTHFNIKRNK